MTSVIVALLTSLSLLVVAVGPGTGSSPGAQTDPSTAWVLPPELPDPPSAATDLTEEAVRAVATEMGIDTSEARRRFEQQPLISQLSQYLEENDSLKDIYAGLWVDHHNGGAVHIAFTRDAAELVSQLREVADPSLSIVAVEAPHSIEQLRTLQEGIVTHRDRDFEGQDVAHAWDGGFDVDIDIMGGEVVITLPDDEGPRTRALEADVESLELDDQPVRILRGEVSRPVCTRTDCRYGMRGGLRVRNASGQNCTSSYSVRANGTTVYGLMSAGHCSGTNRYHGGEYMGYVHGRIVYGSVDALWIKLNSGWATHRWIYRDDNAKAYQIRSTDSYSQTFVTQFVCKSGVTTSLTCGHVTSKNGAPSHVPNAHSFITSTACAQGGDSGSPLYVQGTSRATGLVSSATGSCPSGSSRSGHIQYAQSALLVTVKTW